MGGRVLEGGLEEVSREMGEKVEVDTEKETEPLRRQQQGQIMSCTCLAGSAFFVA